VNGSTGLVTAVATGTTDIVYTVIACNGSPLSSFKTLTVSPNANAGTVSGSTPICIGITTTYASNGDAGGAWSSTNTSVATVNGSTGLVTAVATGTADITYTVSSGCGSPVSSFKTLTVSPNVTAGSVSGTSPICIGATTIFISDGTTGGSWSSTNNSVATVNATTGLVTAVAAGTTDITYTVTSGCGSPVSASRTLTVNAPATVSAGSNQAICAGSTATMAGNFGGGATSATWSTSGTGSFNNNSATAVYTPSAADISATSVTLTYTTDGLTGACGAVSASMVLTINATSGTLVMAGTQVCKTQNVGPSGSYFFDGNCNLISKIIPSGLAPVSSSTTSCVSIEATMPVNGAGQPFIKRHYDITPASTSDSTATVTFYATQAEFDEYNIYVGGLPIAYNLFPANPGGSTTGIRVYQYHGSFGGGGLFDYSGDIEIITPTVVWNSVNSRWEMTINVNGFCGFFIGTIPNVPLPVTLLTFSGYRNGNHNLLKWTTASEVDNLGFQVERSSDGLNYTSIGFVNSLAPNGNSNALLNYTFIDNNISGSKQYYRLRLVDIYRREKLSNVILIKGNRPTLLSIDGLYPNPANNIVNVIVDAPNHDEVTLLVTDVNGKLLMKQEAVVESGVNTIPVNITRFVNGSYFVKIICRSNCVTQVKKFIKQ
jgi:uncharacterized protein YjdB